MLGDEGIGEGHAPWLTCVSPHTTASEPSAVAGMPGHLGASAILSSRAARPPVDDHRPLPKRRDPPLPLPRRPAPRGFPPPPPPRGAARRRAHRRRRLDRRPPREPARQRQRERP